MKRILYIILFIACAGVVRADDVKKPDLQIADNSFFDPTRKEEPVKFLDRNCEIEKHLRNLPHWEQKDAAIFVTFRLADSLPEPLLAQLREERNVWTNAHPEPWDDATRLEYYRSFGGKLDKWLDADQGECLLLRDECREAVIKTLMHGHGVDYFLYAYAVAANHVHVLLTLRDGRQLSKIVQAWKGVSAKDINRMLGRIGKLWQDEYFDRLIRHETHFARAVMYVEGHCGAWVSDVAKRAIEEWRGIFGEALGAGGPRHRTPLRRRESRDLAHRP